MGWIQPPPVFRFQSSTLFWPTSCSHTMHLLGLRSAHLDVNQCQAQRATRCRKARGTWRCASEAGHGAVLSNTGIK
jgi:hypothetical protein